MTEPAPLPAKLEAGLAAMERRALTDLRAFAHKSLFCDSIRLHRQTLLAIRDLSARVAELEAARRAEGDSRGAGQP